MCLSLVHPLPALSQSKSDGSVYGGFGVGERRSIHTSQAMGMGVIGVGLFTPGYLNVANPAAYADQVFTRFSGGLDFTGVRSTDAGDQSSTSSGGNIGAVHFGFPLISRRLGVAASYGPYTNAGYRAATFGVLDAEDGEPGTIYESNYEGDGGLQEFTVGVGYSPVRAVSIGASMSALWGITEDAVRTAYSNVASFVGTSNQRVTTRLSGVTASVGLVVRAAGLLGDGDALTVGASAMIPTTLTGARTSLVNQGLTFTDTVGTAVDAEVSIPARFRAGITYTPSAHWLFVADGSFEPWSNFESNLRFRGYDPDGSRPFNDLFRVGAGAQFIAAGSDPFAGKLARTALRMGFFVSQAYAAPEPDYKLITYGVAAGLSIPTSIPTTYLDLAAEIGTRGESEGFLVKDLLYRISVTLNFGERWFIQRRLR
jgi:hypothetical protein